MTDSREVYLVHHVRDLDDDDAQDVKFIGVFSDVEKAASAIEKIKHQVGFRDFPDGFLVEACTLNRAGWLEGFTTLE